MFLLVIRFRRGYFFVIRFVNSACFSIFFFVFMDKQNDETPADGRRDRASTVFSDRTTYVNVTSAECTKDVEEEELLAPPPLPTGDGDDDDDEGKDKDEEEMVLFVDQYLKDKYRQFLTTIDCSVVIFNYSGSVVNDSYVTWKSACNTFRYFNAAIEDEDALGYMSWRTHPCGTLDSFLFHASQQMYGMDSHKWLTMYRQKYHARCELERLNMQQSITMAPGFIEFTDKLDLLGIPWFIKVGEDFVNTEQMLQEFSLLCSFSYVLSKDMRKRTLDVHDVVDRRFNALVSEGHYRHLDNKGLDRLRQFLSINEFLGVVKREMRQKKKRDAGHETNNGIEEDVENHRILWLVDNVGDCDVGKQLGVRTAATLWGANDCRIFAKRRDVQCIDPIKGYLSLL